MSRSCCFLSLSPCLSPFLCSQSAVVSAPYRRWVEKLSWETKRTEEERQVGRKGGLEWRRAIVWGLGKCSCTEEIWKTPISSERKEKMRSRYLRWMETTGMSAQRWSWCVYVAHLRRVWSLETEVCFYCFVPLQLFIEAHNDSAKKRPCLVDVKKLLPVFLSHYCLGYFRGWQFKRIASSLKSKFPKQHCVFKVVRCQALIVGDDIPWKSNFFCFVFFLKALFSFRAAGESWTICQTCEFNAFFVFSFLNEI